jgi:hypothetical protein
MIRTRLCLQLHIDFIFSAGSFGRYQTFDIFPWWKTPRVYVADLLE